MHLQPLGFYLFSPSIKMSIRKLQSLFVCQQTNVTFLWIQIETFVFPVKTMTWIKCCLYFLQLFDRIFNSTVILCICRSGRGELHRCGQKLRLNCCSGKTIAGKSQEPEHLQSGSSVFFNLKKKWLGNGIILGIVIGALQNSRTPHEAKFSLIGIQSKQSDIFGEIQKSRQSVDSLSPIQKKWQYGYKKKSPWVTRPR